MTQTFDFEEIRPYRDEEVQSVIERILADDQQDYFQVAKHAFPGMTREAVEEKLREIQSIQEYQQMVIHPSVKMCMDHSTDGLTTEGFDQLDPDQAYLFISNHRDIVLDPCVLNFILFNHGLKSAEIAIGSNLLVTKMVTDVVKLNDNFVVNRDVQPRQLYEYSTLLSNYIHDTIGSRNKSVWIAQREGRAKDGNDKTQAGLLKMFTLGGSGSNFIENIERLNIVPVSISYEYNPCDHMLAHELRTKHNTGEYNKKPGEDLKSMETGIRGYKGRVHFVAGKPINKRLSELEGITNKNEQVRKLAEMIDGEIYRNYKLWPGNWIAYDIVNDQDHITKYSKEERMHFMQYLGSRIMMGEGNKGELREFLLKMYANPVKNFLNKSIV